MIPHSQKTTKVLGGCRMIVHNLQLQPENELKLKQNYVLEMFVLKMLSKIIIHGSRRFQILMACVFA